jgi:hypothetical protein
MKTRRVHVMDMLFRQQIIEFGIQIEIFLASEYHQDKAGNLYA